MPPILKRIEDPGTLKDKAFKVIKRAIMAHELQPGKIYGVPEMARHLGISRSPVREALLDLAAKGFITFHPRRGVQINVLTRKDIRHLVSFRGILERSIVENIVACGLSEEQLRRIEKYHNRFLAAADEDDIARFLEADRNFHTLLASLTGNPYIIAALENVRDLVDWTNYELIRGYNRVPEVLEEHLAIFERIMAKDGPGAAEMMDRHLQVALRRMLEHLVKSESTDRPDIS